MVEPTLPTGSEPIPPDLFAHLVELAALALDPQEADYLRGQLNRQLAAIRELEAIPLDEGVEITSHGVPYTPAISPPPRRDEQQPSPQADAILAQAPETEGRYIVVPDIPHTDLS